MAAPRLEDLPRGFVDVVAEVGDDRPAGSVGRGLDGDPSRPAGLRQPVAVDVAGGAQAVDAGIHASELQFRERL